ncbi:cell division protein FtsZ [Selenomonas sp. TAMA-11512]|uniref:cell division protein FtsZ n=1 Tax=Selenomonas sp. TAMA-11512 TaxID=3095337 RepID=UPI00308FB29D|nr:cell division protein FtsZ [Selenomonas sp. TAMA-11512]
MAEMGRGLKRAIVTIKIIGVGGGGNSVLRRIAEYNFPGVELVAVNTDVNQLESLAGTDIRRLQIGEGLTKGRGTGGVTSLGETAAKADAALIKTELQGADLVFIIAAMGGGVGTGAAPVIAKYAKEMGILTMGVVTIPFAFEGERKKATAMNGISKLKAMMDALIVIENESLLKLPEYRQISFLEAFKAADDILITAIRCVSELILTTGGINVDFADLRTILKSSIGSDALLGVGSSVNNAVQAVKNAIESPLVNRPLEGARAVILNISGDESLRLLDVQDATQYIQGHAHPDVNIIVGTVLDERLGDEIKVMIIATDFADTAATVMPHIEPLEEKLEEIAPLLGTKVGQKEIELPDFMNHGKRVEKPAFSEGGGFSIPRFRTSNEDENR